MSTQTYEPLRAVPPLDQKERMGWLLQARQYARRALDRVLSVPRAAAAWVGSVLRTPRAASLLGRLRHLGARLARPVLAAARGLGVSGVAAAVTTAITSPACRGLLSQIGGAIARGLRWVARTLYSALDSGLRCFGGPGNRAADLLFGGVVSLGGRIAAVAAPVVHRVARFSDPEAVHVRLLGGVARSYLLHKVVGALFAHPLLRLLVEGVLLPAVLDSRAVQWLRTQLRLLRERAWSPQEQTETVAKLQPVVPAAASGSGSATGGIPMPPWEPVDDEAAPNNRAERRAQDRLTRTRRPS